MVKNLLFLSLSLILFNPTYSQEYYISETPVLYVLKPEKGKFNTELNLNPFDGGLKLNNLINQLKFRYFYTENIAIRIGFAGNRLKQEEDQNNPYGNNPVKYKDEKSMQEFALNIGFEKHFAGTKRLSPYIGGDVFIAIKNSEQERVYQEEILTIKGAWLSTLAPSTNFPYPSYLPEQRAFNQYGINIITGFDYYMDKNFYFGYEINYIFRNTVFKKIEAKQENQQQVRNIYNQLKSAEFFYGPALMNGIRIGYIF